MRKRAEIQSFPTEKQDFDKRMSVLWQKSLPQCPFWYYNFNVGYFIPKKRKRCFKNGIGNNKGNV